MQRPEFYFEKTAIDDIRKKVRSMPSPSDVVLRPGAAFGTNTDNETTSATEPLTMATPPRPPTPIPSIRPAKLQSGRTDSGDNATTITIDDDEPSDNGVNRSEHDTEPENSEDSKE